MEQARYWMWAKRKPDLNPHNILTPPAAAMNSYGDSWEEQAFAEDAAGTLGGCVWPPRSYSCSFCRREFRSAQALGGHMNVHRRDRARLKQSPIPAPADVAVPQHNHSLNACTSPFDAPMVYPSHTSTFLYNNHNPNPEFSSVPFSRVIRVSSPPPAKVINGDDQDKNISTLSFFSSLVQKNDKGSIVISASDPPSWSSFVSGKKRDRDGLDLIKEEEKKSTVVIVEPDQESRAEKEDCVTEDLATNLNLVVCRRETDDDGQVASCKRRKIEVKPLSFFTKLSAVDRCLPQSEVLKLRNSASSEELDLELRLGDAPKRDLSEVQVWHMGYHKLAGN